MQTHKLMLTILLALTACGEAEAPKARVAPALAAQAAQVPVPAVEEPLPAPVLPEVSPVDLALAPVEAPPVAPTHAWRLRHGESLAHFARWSGVPVEDIAKASELDLEGQYPPGTEVRVPAEGVLTEQVDARREAHWQRKLNGYLASRGGEQGVETYAVRTGDSAWTIATKGQGVPMWVLAAYNPDVRLDNLRPGQRLNVPVLADTVVDAAPPAPAEASIVESTELAPEPAAE